MILLSPYKELVQDIRVYSISFLWSKYNGEKGLPIVPWDVCIMPKDEGGIGLIDVTTQGHI